MGTDVAVAAGGPGTWSSVARLRVKPLIRAIPPEWVPIRALAAVGRRPYTMFFESGGSPAPESEWTMLAFDPLWRLVIRDGRLINLGARPRADLLSGHPLDALALAWPPRIEYDPPSPVPFTAGLAGYLSYDLKDWIERYPSRALREIDVPDLSLRFYDVVWAWNRATGAAWVISTGLGGEGDGGDPGRAKARLEEQWLEMKEGIATNGRALEALHAATDTPRSDDKLRSLTSNFTRDDYRRAVERALERIAAGDIYQVNLAQRFRAESSPPALHVYGSLRAIAPAPFSGFASLPDGGFASSSPERFFSVRGERIETWPIKGTRPRGGTRDADAKLAAELLQSEKDQAENVMIVDLERNDLGKVCEIGSVRVPELWGIRSHSNVHHLESRVEGRLAPDTHPVNIIRALFPGGSITGAPKIRAVQIIDELEPVRRGLYTGALGYWDASGDCDWNIAIRTISIVRGVAYFHAGGGIVADSTPEGEYEETLVKATGMMRALGMDPAVR